METLQHATLKVYLLVSNPVEKTSVYEHNFTKLKWSLTYNRIISKIYLSANKVGTLFVDSFKICIIGIISLSQFTD